MTRKLKAPGVTLVAVIAIGAVMAAAAQAQPQFTAASYPATGEATTSNAVGSENEYFESIGRKIECEVTHFHFTVTTTTSGLTVTFDVTDHTQGGNCRAGGTLVTTVTENGCDLDLTPTFVIPGGFSVQVSLTCTEKPYTLHVRNLLNTGNACTITIGTQTAGGTLTAKNNGGHVDISGTVSIASTVHSSNTALCGVEAGKSKEVNTNYRINKAITFKGTTNPGGASDNISISGE